MAYNELPPIELLRQVFKYNPETGKFYWKILGPEMFMSLTVNPRRRADEWNSKNGGKEAFLCVNTSGYLKRNFWGINIPAHRAAWAIFYGEWPNSIIDHINGDRKDNRISNLRKATHTENSRNAKGRSNNTSGVTGVSWNKLAGKWSVNIGGGGKKIHLGHFVKFQDAVQVRMDAEVTYGYTVRHGTFGDDFLIPKQPDGTVRLDKFWKKGTKSSELTKTRISSAKKGIPWSDARRNAQKKGG